MIKQISYGLFVLLLFFAPAGTTLAATLDESLLSVESRWAEAAYKTEGRQQGRELKNLLAEVRSLHKMHPNSAEAAAWHGVVARTCMESKGSMRLAREARDALLTAESYRA